MRTTPKLRHWALLGAALVLLLATVLWSATRGSEAAPQPTDHAATQNDPHAGHDMAGMTTADGAVHLDPAQVRALGINMVEAELAPVRREIRTTGHVAYDETRLSTITPKFGGFVERLYVDFTGQPVRRGQPLLEIYSPELVSAQEELLTAVRLDEQLARSAAPGVAERTSGLADAARRRLQLWDISAAQIERLERTGQVRRTLTLHAPFSGFVVEKMVQAGQAVDAGMVLYRLADLASVWIEADIYEQDLRFVRLGEPVAVEIAAYPGERFSGRVSYVYPEVRPDTRTARVRADLGNPGGRIKPGMFATVTLDIPVAERAVLVPRDAVMHSGTHAMVFVEEAPGLYRAREVQVGADTGGRTEILSGLLAGELVVARANFLLDAESRLRESMGAMPGMNH